MPCSTYFTSITGNEKIKLYGLGRKHVLAYIIYDKITIEHVKLSLLQYLKLKIFGQVFIRMEKRPCWNGALPLYLTKCKTHNIYFLDYPHGFNGRLDCPKCVNETIKKWEKTQT